MADNKRDRTPKAQSRQARSQPEERSGAVPSVMALGAPLDPLARVAALDGSHTHGRDDAGSDHEHDENGGGHAHEHLHTEPSRAGQGLVLDREAGDGDTGDSDAGDSAAGRGHEDDEHHADDVRGAPLPGTHHPHDGSAGNHLRSETRLGRGSGDETHMCTGLGDGARTGGAARAPYRHRRLKQTRDRCQGTKPARAQRAQSQA